VPTNHTKTSSVFAPDDESPGFLCEASEARFPLNAHQRAGWAERCETAVALLNRVRRKLTVALRVPVARSGDTRERSPEGGRVAHGKDEATAAGEDASDLRGHLARSIAIRRYATSVSGSVPRRWG